MKIAAALASLAFAAVAAAPAHAEISPCRPVAVSQTHGQGFEAFCRLAYIDRGSVPCVDRDTAKARMCRFTPSSGSWLKSTRGGLYALAGQPISRRGNAGGRFIVASKRSIDDPAPCMQDPHNNPLAHAADTAGASKGTPLPGGCVVEVAGSLSNTTGFQLDNYATKTVCGGAFSAYDVQSATPVPAMESPGVRCFTGEGAGLNDVNGQERDINGNYFAGARYCHVMYSNGVEVYAAKRPATIGLPARVDVHSAVAWRPVSSLRGIAN